MDDESVADQAKSCEDLGKLKMEVLKLKCNKYGLVVSSPTEADGTLHYQPE